MSLTFSFTTISRVVTGSGQRVGLVGDKESQVDEQSRYRHRNISLSLTLLGNMPSITSKPLLNSA